MSIHLLHSIFATDEEDLLPPIFSLRAKRRAIRLADYLLNEKGLLIPNRVEEMFHLLKTSGYLAQSHNIDDVEITRHFLTIIDFFRQQPRSFTQVGLPLCNRDIEQVMQIILNLDRPLIDRDISWAIFSALLCPLRQSIGSCFATAPAILIQKEYPQQCLLDLQSMLSTGVLKRVIAGTEFIVPMSPTPGLGELKREIEIGENTAHMPALYAAFSAAGWLKKLSMHDLLSPFFGSKMSLLELIEEVVREYFSLSQEALQNYRSSPTPSHVRGNADKVEEMMSTLRLVKWHFVAFTDHLLLKIWEFTLASLADVKMEFSGWNLFSSLGLHPQEKGGLGAVVYHHLEAKLQEANEKLSHFQQEYEIAFDQVRATESLLRAASTEADARRLKMEHYSRSYHLQVCVEMRDKYAKQTETIANFFPFFIETLGAFFPEYFQEIYDPEMHEIKADPSDDSPAGFRLAYKHGRAHAANWTFIYTKEEWLRALRDFFLSMELRIKDRIKTESELALFTAILTAMNQHLNDPEFVKTAFLRMAKAHHITLPKMEMDLEAFEKKPWAYSSGGTIRTLLKTYFRYEGNITEITKWVESPTDLCVFLIDTLKDLPPRIMNLYSKNHNKRMLITSPTHAFNLLPGKEKFRQAWEHAGFTYTWVRDTIVIPEQRFYHGLTLSPEEQRVLIEKFSARLPLMQGHELQRSFVPTAYGIKPSTFYQKMRVEHPYISSTLWEIFLFEALPIESDSSELHSLCKEWNISQKNLPTLPMTRREIHEWFVQALREKNHSPYFSYDVHQKVHQEMEKRNLAPPLPLLFADSNWAEIFFFAFLVNPATEELELWRTDSHGIQGMPMKDWKPWLDGSHKTPWEIFSHPHQYMI